METKKGLQLLRCEKCGNIHLFPSKPGVTIAFADASKTTFNWTCHFCNFPQSSNPADLLSLEEVQPINIDEIPKINI